jgi:hypothetical protein
MDETNFLDELEALLREYFHSNKKLAVLVGAGISKPSPSKLPLAGELMMGTLSKLFPLSLQKIIPELISAERVDRRNSKDFIRFEWLTEALQAFDKNLDFLECFNMCKIPNRNHTVLAALIQQGHYVMTTNFDALIEIACEKRNFSAHTLVYEADYARFLNRHAEKPLIKLHGSLEQNGNSSRDSLRATLAQVTQPGGLDIMLERPKLETLKEIIQNHDLLVLGYSGADDFDIIPALSSIRSPGRKIIWINHQGSDLAPNAMPYEEITQSAKDNNGYYLAERVKLLTDLVTKNYRNKEDVWLINLDTDLIIQIIENILGVPKFNQETVFEFNLSRYLEEWIRKYMPAAQMKWAFAASILFERERYHEAFQIYDKLRKEAMERLWTSQNIRQYLVCNDACVNILLRLEKFEDAENKLLESKKLVYLSLAKQAISNFNHQLGYLYFNQGDINFNKRDLKKALLKYKQSISYYRVALVLAKLTRDQQGVCSTLHQLGLVFAKMAATQHIEAIMQLETAQQKGWQTQGTVHILLLKMIVSFREFLRSRGLNNAIRYFRASKKIAKQNGLWNNYCLSAGQEAGCYHLLKQYSSEADILKEVLPRIKLLGSNYLIGRSYGQLGRSYLYLKDFELAIIATVIAQRFSVGQDDPLNGELKSVKDEISEKIGGTTFDSRWEVLNQETTQSLDKILYKQP